MLNNRPCGPSRNEFPNAYGYNELLDLAERKLNISRSQAEKYNRKQLCEMLGATPNLKKTPIIDLTLDDDDEEEEMKEREPKRIKRKAPKASGGQGAGQVGGRASAIDLGAYEMIEPSEQKEQLPALEVLDEFGNVIREIQGAEIEEILPVLPKAVRDPNKVCTDSKKHKNRYTKGELAAIGVEEKIFTSRRKAEQMKMKDLCEALGMVYIEPEVQKQPENVFEMIADLDEKEEKVPSNNLRGSLDGLVKRYQAMKINDPNREAVLRELLKRNLQHLDELKLPCIEDATKDKPLQPHQKLVLYNLLRTNQKGMLTVHGVGSGKTLIAVIAANCFIKAYPDRKVIVVTPASLQGNFAKEMKNVGLNPDDQDHFVFMTFDGMMNLYKNEGPSACQKQCYKNMLIVDEAHNLRTPTTKKFIAVNECAQVCAKVLLLTATPIFNGPFDIMPLMSLINPKAIEVVEKYKEKIGQFNKIAIDNFGLTTHGIDQIMKYFGCNISFYYPPEEKLKEYPGVDQHYKYFLMDEETYKHYMVIEKDNKEKLKGNITLEKLFDDVQEKDLRRFLNGVRQATSMATSSKYVFIEQKLQELLEDPLKVKKYVLYADHEKTREFLRNILTKLKIPFKEISGSIDKKVRQTIVDEFNDRIVPVLIISSAGEEGLDLKGTSDIFIVEPAWNLATTSQIIGRGVRFRSHIHLPEQFQHVNVWHLLLVKPTEHKYITKLQASVRDDPDGSKFQALLINKEPTEISKATGETVSVDLHLMFMQDRKQRVINEFQKNLLIASIENNYCGRMK
jgi:SNF2 family DNA or RNA helicase